MEILQVGVTVDKARQNGLARSFTRNPIFRLFGSGGAISSRIASNTTLNWASYFFSRAASLRARSL